MKMDELIEYNKKQAKVINDLGHNQKILIDRISKLEQSKSKVDTQEVVNEAVDRIISQVEKRAPAPAAPAAPTTPAEPTTAAATTTTEPASEPTTSTATTPTDKTE